MRVFHDRAVYNGADGTKLRGGQVTALSASSMTITLHLEEHRVGTRTVIRSLAPTAILFDPVCCEVTGDGAESYTITALHPTRFLNRWAANRESDGYQPGRVPEHLSGDPGFIPWYAGLQRDRSTSD